MSFFLFLLFAFIQFQLICSFLSDSLARRSVVILLENTHGYKHIDETKYIFQGTEELI